MKIKRDAFLYLEGAGDTFAQCGSCIFGYTHCAIMNGRKVSARDGSCGFYIKGHPIAQEVIAQLTSEQAGYVERPVRCENCRFYGQGHCSLYRILNQRHAALFDLEEKVEAKGCCNANEER
jgi:hypothetical protein